MSGKLFVVATPIGNYGDMTPRAIEVLSEVALIAVEDSRHSGRLLKNFGIKTRTQALHDHNEKSLAPKLIEELIKGINIALISDAGTPLISDPGFKLVQLAQQANIQVVPIPGPAALITALSAAGLATDRFCFEGFLPSKKTARQTQLQEYRAETRTMVFYEAPHRILDCLIDMKEIFGASHTVVVARELTKTFETIRRDNLENLVAWVSSDPNQQKGELVVIVEGFKSQQDGQSLDPESERVLQLLLQELTVKQAVKLAVDICGEKKKVLYQRALQIKGSE